MAYVVSERAERTIELTSEEANHLAYTAASQAHAIDDFRYNGLANAHAADMMSELDTGERTMAARNAWTDRQSERDAQQLRWCDIATLLNPERYPEGWKDRG